MSSNFPIQLVKAMLKRLSKAVNNESITLEEAKLLGAERQRLNKEICRLREENNLLHELMLDTMHDVVHQKFVLCKLMDKYFNITRKLNDKEVSQSWS